ncbi:hypothetical protein N665_0117s0031 [Sinapis alba]|nr:hypothetical protein N665_0117s0031 [Sinapis alba]
MEREAYEVIVEDGRLMYKQSMTLINSTDESKSIFVLSTTRTLYVGKKKKGVFQHSSFLSGGATTAAGRLVACDGILEEHNVDLTNVKRCAVNEEYSSSFKSTEDKEEEEEQKKLSCKWSSGYGPRIGCVRDYLVELQAQALEQVNLSPRVSPVTLYGPIPSPRPTPKVWVSPWIPSSRGVKC